MLVYQTSCYSFLKEERISEHKINIFLFPPKSLGRQLFQNHLCKLLFYDNVNNYRALQSISSRSTLHLMEVDNFWKIFGALAVKTLLVKRYQK